MPKISVNNSAQTVEYNTGKDLLQILLENKILVDNPCNGKGTCGKCKIKILEGTMPDPSETEKKLLKEEELAAGIRLACLLFPAEDLKIEVLHQERKHKILETGYLPEFDFLPSVHKKVIKIEKPTLDNQISYEDALAAALEIKKINWKLLQNDIMYGENTAVFYGEELIGLESGDTGRCVYGMAVDIGTTTVVASLVDINSGEELATASLINPQKKYGMDVLTRITYALGDGDKARKKLQQAIVDALNDMMDELCRQATISRAHIYEITVSANCTMLHFLLGIKAESIGKSPYAPVFAKSKSIDAGEIGLMAAPGAKLYCLPSVSAYIGADIVAGAYVCRLYEDKGNILFIDIGTNGEIVLSHQGRLMSCSCAAGPALEGMNISSGMRAAEGAIEDLVITEDGIEIKVIGDTVPVGICGSGILAAVKELIRTGLVKKSGAFIKKDTLKEDDYRWDLIRTVGEKREFVITDGESGLTITQSDIRQVQLAKGAILSGFYALLQQAGLGMDQLDQVVIAGQFGSHLPAESLAGVGIIPDEVSDKLSYVGNSSKSGAYMALMSVQVKNDLEKLAHQINYFELGATEGYEKLFSGCLVFPG